jgi:PTH1 family peptidyl-tRNA hydrolase
VAQAIIGLGNPGPEYRDTRHNVGQRVVETLARRLHARFAREAGHQVARTAWQNERLYLVKPTCFMNVSGPVVARMSCKLGLDRADLVIVFDDLDLPLGKVRARKKGSAGGHRGVRSVIEALGTDVFRRVKVGIGRPAQAAPERDRVVDHVLSPFYPDEREAIESACAEAGDLALKLVEGRA